MAFDLDFDELGQRVKRGAQALGTQAQQLGAQAAGAARSAYDQYAPKVQDAVGQAKTKAQSALGAAPAAAEPPLPRPGVQSVPVEEINYRPFNGTAADPLRMGQSGLPVGSSATDDSLVRIRANAATRLHNQQAAPALDSLDNTTSTGSPSAKPTPAETAQSALDKAAKVTGDTGRSKLGPVVKGAGLGALALAQPVVNAKEVYDQTGGDLAETGKQILHDGAGLAGSAIGYVTGGRLGTAGGLAGGAGGDYAGHLVANKVDSFLGGDGMSPLEAAQQRQAVTQGGGSGQPPIAPPATALGAPEPQPPLQVSRPGLEVTGAQVAQGGTTRTAAAQPAQVAPAQAAATAADLGAPGTGTLSFIGGGQEAMARNNRAADIYAGMNEDGRRQIAQNRLEGQLAQAQASLSYARQTGDRARAVDLQREIDSLNGRLAEDGRNNTLRDNARTQAGASLAGSRAAAQAQLAAAKAQSDMVKLQLGLGKDNTELDDKRAAVNREAAAQQAADQFGVTNEDGKKAIPDATAQMLSAGSQNWVDQQRQALSTQLAQLQSAAASGDPQAQAAYKAAVQQRDSFIRGVYKTDNQGNVVSTKAWDEMDPAFRQQYLDHVALQQRLQAPQTDSRAGTMAALGALIPGAATVANKFPGGRAVGALATLGAGALGYSGGKQLTGARSDVAQGPNGLDPTLANNIASVVPDGDNVLLQLKDGSRVSLQELANVNQNPGVLGYSRNNLGAGKADNRYAPVADAGARHLIATAGQMSADDLAKASAYLQRFPGLDPRLAAQLQALNIQKR